MSSAHRRRKVFGQKPPRAKPSPAAIWEFSQRYDKKLYSNLRATIANPL
jgi:hypothetical protein